MKVYTLSNAKTNLHSIAKEVSETDTKVYIIAKNKKLLVLMPVTPNHFKETESESNN